MTLLSPCAGPFNHQTQAFPGSCVQLRAPLLKSSRLQTRHCCFRVACVILLFAWVSEMRCVVSISHISCRKLTCGFSLSFSFFFFLLSPINSLYLLLLFWITTLLRVAQQWSGLCLKGYNKASSFLYYCFPLGVHLGAVLVPFPCLTVRIAALAASFLVVCP